MPMQTLGEILRCYEREVMVQEVSGQYVRGRWVPGEAGELVTIMGVPLPLTPDDLERYSAGEYTRQDYKLYVRAEEGEINRGARVTFDGREYECMEGTDYTEYGGYRRYMLKKRGEG